MQRWEHLLLIRHRKGNDVKLDWEDTTQPAGHSTNVDELGAEGWELVAVVPQVYVLSGEYRAVVHIVLNNEKQMPIAGWLAPVLVTYYFKRLVQDP
jgi:hypothetical protein